MGDQGAEGEPILGNCHHPQGDPHGIVLIAHGFKGYKDYGMLPVIAAAFADAGFIAHRFNFSHSGMTNEIETFARPDLFCADTWNKQVADVWTVIQATHHGDLAGARLPQVLFGHSRGGVSVLLTAGRFATDPSFPAPRGIVTAAAPSSCNSLTDEQIEQLMRDGYLVSPSSRTGQELRVGRGYVQEQLETPMMHDLLSLVSSIRCRLLVIHGARDETVPVRCAQELSAAALRAQTLVIEDADHVFNTPNPVSEGALPSPALAQLIEAATQFAQRCCSADG